jgi:hypothetical protein
VTTAAAGVPSIEADDVPLLIEFAPGTSIYHERDRASQLPIVGNGPAGTFVVFPGRLRVSVPTDQVVLADDSAGCARVGFGGMRFVGLEGALLVFVRVRELHPEHQLSPARSHTMTLEPGWVSSVFVHGRIAWRG